MTPAKGGSCSRFSNLSYAFRRQPAHDALAGAAASRGRRDRRSTGTAGLCESRAEPAVVVERRCKNLPAYPEQSRAIYAYATPAELPEATSGAIGLRPAFCAKQPAGVGSLCPSPSTAGLPALKDSFPRFGQRRGLGPRCRKTYARRPRLFLASLLAIKIEKGTPARSRRRLPEPGVPGEAGVGRRAAAIHYPKRPRSFLACL